MAASSLELQGLSLLNSQTAAERAEAAALAAVRALLTKKSYQALFQTLLTARRLYVVAYRELQQQLTKEPDLPGQTEDLLVQAAAHAGAKPFDERAVVEDLLQGTGPWLATLVDEHLRADQAAQRQARQETLEERKAKAFTLAYPVSLDAPARVLPRSCSLVLTGEPAAVRWLLHTLVDALLADRPLALVVLWLATKAPAGPAPPGVVRLGPSLWQGCANSRKTLALWHQQVMQRVPREPDLLVCDDLALAYSAGFIGRPVEANAGDAHKMLRRWCHEHGCGLMAGLPNAAAPDIMQPAWEQLRTFTWVRVVELAAQAAAGAPPLADGCHRISMQRPAQHWDVRNLLTSTTQEMVSHGSTDQETPTRGGDTTGSLAGGSGPDARPDHPGQRDDQQDLRGVSADAAPGGGHQEPHTEVRRAE